MLIKTNWETSQWYLSDRYLVMSFGDLSKPGLRTYTLDTYGDEVLVAYPPLSEGRHKTKAQPAPAAQGHIISLPSRPMWISGMGDLVGFLTRGRELCLWKIGGELTTLPLPRAKDSQLKSSPSTFYISFIPGWEGFAVSRVYDGVSTASDAPAHIVVDLYRSQKFSETYEIEVPAECCPFKLLQPLVTGEGLTWQLKGRFVDVEEGTNIPGCDHSLFTMEFVNFDVARKTFSFRTYQLAYKRPASAVTTRTIPQYSFHLWRDRLLISTAAAGDPYRGNVLEEVQVGNSLVVSLYPQESQSSGPSTHTAIGTGNDMPQEQKCLMTRAGYMWRWLADRELIQECEQICARERESEDAVARPERQNLRCTPSLVKGDDEFTILYGQRCGMIIWSHNKDMQLAGTRSTHKSV